ncbi:MAG: 16S rRNA (cytosine(1402)-N(4))-methyltransferase RsmH [Bacilli bacterium]|nr:16S rRNA (cytosine(1402)-N(4))-methyltransferase RsmH [Bacilli bacterium]MBR1749150.1 16S rRNA (cytosine(1402)-N(4))-methyltransferase RsmH [Bacilli bacterium]MBR1817288.1 16S rRNA (cytosine(1402)-N(4))-methyltransferase RsmH [Bacilli bacterium]
MKHYTVLKKESIEGLNLNESSIVVDATLGYGGDSKEILNRIKRGKLFAFDRDKDAINYSDALLSEVGDNYTLIHSDFVHMKEKLKELKVDKVDAILFDLGVSSPQLDENRGFSFMRDEKLDMRMNREEDVTAEDVVNQYSYEELKNIFYKYGEEKRSPFIAKAIIERRKTKRIETTKELCDAILEGVGANYYYKTHPERNIFQAIRICVNQELTDLEAVLPDAISLLNKGGRLCVVTFHSLEDRIVKNIFKKYSEENELVKGLPEIPEEYKPLCKVITKKPILPSKEELEENSRSASAKLRILERL